jgi:protein gp37
MNKTAIEYADYTHNIVTGCTRGCLYCYAHRLAHGRLKTLYLSNPHVAPGCDPSDSFSPRFWPSRLDQPAKVRQPSKIFMVDMGDLWDPHVPPEWVKSNLDVARRCDWHTFIFLTKRPDYASVFDFPQNAWVGITLTDDTHQSHMRAAAFEFLEAPIRFYSVEPFLGYIPNLPANLDWLIIGGMTGSEEDIYAARDKYSGTKAVLLNGKWTLQPHSSWLVALLTSASHHNIPVFTKDNLNVPHQIRQWPK